MDGRGAPKAPPLTEGLLVVCGWWRMESHVLASGRHRCTTPINTWVVLTGLVGVLIIIWKEDMPSAQFTRGGNLECTAWSACRKLSRLETVLSKWLSCFRPLPGSSAPLLLEDSWYVLSLFYSLVCLRVTLSSLCCLVLGGPRSSGSDQLQGLPEAIWVVCPLSWGDSLQHRMWTVSISGETATRQQRNSNISLSHTDNSQETHNNYS